ncbi:MAG: hypothetical protein VX223_09880, partial [Myxococcota bacterium]|nr:hypothetical protein [Myxococcota bacterium]
CSGTSTGLCSCTTDAQCEQNYGNSNACDGFLQCVDGLCTFDSSTVPSCSSDGNTLCRQNQCQSTGSTTHTCNFVAINNGATCWDGNPCTIGDVCSNASCQGAIKNCSDGQFCNGAETCQATTGTCLPGSPPNPNDGIACTYDYCDEALNKIVNAPQNQVCDNGQFCDGAETCVAGTGGGCQSNPLDVDDGVACTVDSCDEGNDKIDHVPDNTKCNDGKFCNGTEVCSATQNCVSINVPNLNDGLNCTADTCDEATDTIIHTANNTLCDDNNPCTTDVCVVGQGCIHEYHSNPCDDGEVCTTNDKCTGGVCLGTSIDPACSCVPGETDCEAEYGDGNACNGYLECQSDLQCHVVNIPTCSTAGDTQCLKNKCVSQGATSATCQNVPEPSSVGCDDGSACTVNDKCNGAGACIGGAAPCDDGNPCTNDLCNPAAGCYHTYNTSTCNDGDFCTYDDTCSNGVCQGTVYSAGCQCVGDGKNSQCNQYENGNLCDGTLVCQNFKCVLDTATIVSCPVDTNTCTDNICQPGTGVCQSTVVNVGNACNDGVACTFNDVCQADGDCDGTAQHTFCDNALFCDGTEYCHVELGCKSGSPPVLDDGKSCTIDACDESSDTITHTPTDSLCNDGQFCNGIERCSAINNCYVEAGTVPLLPAASGCVTYACNEATDQVQQVLNDTVCNDNNTCTTDFCSANGCLHTNVAQGTSCILASNADACASDFQCNDSGDCVGTAVAPACVGCDLNDPTSCSALNSYCGGTYTCTDLGNGASKCEQTVAGPDCASQAAPLCRQFVCDNTTESCVLGNLPNGVACNDGDNCTVIDSCNGGTCAGIPKACSDGNQCTGTEFCDPNDGACKSDGIAPNPDDNIACTVDFCDITTGQIVNTPVNAACSDGVFCNGVEICNSVSGCQPSSGPLSIDDGFECTTDLCDETIDQIIHTPVSSKCDDGKFCNGNETCQVGKGCVSGTPPSLSDGVACTIDTCDEVNDIAVNTPDNTYCDDGNLCTTDTCVKTAGTGCVFANNSLPCDDGQDCSIGDTCAGGSCVAVGTKAGCECPPAGTSCEAVFGDANPCNGTFICEADFCKIDPATIVFCDPTGNDNCNK